MDEEVVLVTIQYRLGPLGFLSLQNEDIKVRQCTDKQIYIITIYYRQCDRNTTFFDYLHVHMFPQEQHVLLFLNNIV